jgi:glycerophosphoryl diester phosphodiesterase
MRNLAISAIVILFASLILLSGCKPPQNLVTSNTDLDVCVYDPDCTDKMALGHRGTGAYNLWATENTLYAYEYAWEMGADSVEIDVRQTKDGELVIMHNATVDFTTNGKGNVSDMTLAELKALRMYSVNPGVPVQSVPTFKEALGFIKGKMLIDIDLKSREIAKIIGEIEETGMINSAYLGIDSLAEALLARSINPGTAIMPKVATLEEAREYVENASPVAFFEIEYENATPELVDYIHSNGIKIHINSLTTYDLLGKLGFKMVFDRGADIIQTDRLDILVPYINSL